MIESLKTIGEYAQEKSNESLLIQLVDNPNSNGQYEKVLLIIFENIDDILSYKEIVLEEFSKDKLDKYAYKYGSSRGGDLTPTSKITDLEKTFVRIQNPLKKLCNKFNGDSISQMIILSIYNMLKDEDISNTIFEDLKNVFDKIDNSAILTIGVLNNGQIKYVGDFEEFTKSLLERYEKKFYFKSSYTKADKESIGQNNVCYICSKKSAKTYGYVGTYSFYTLDKLGFTSGGFKRGKSWKNYPVCPGCAKLLDLGKDYLSEYLSSRFCGINYSIIPKTIFDADENDKDDIFGALEYLEEHKKMSLKRETKNRITDTQDELIAVMSEFENYINFNLMFFEEKNSAFRILLYIEDVLPSYIKEIFAAKDYVDKQELFKELIGKDGDIFDMKFRFNIISDFFYINKTNKPDLSKQFLEITNSVFSNQNISYQLLMERFISHLQEKFRNGESTWYDNLKAIMILKFMDRLNLVPDMRKGANVLLIDDQGKYRKKLEYFIEEHNDILNSNAKILAFLVGVLAQKLLNIQKSETDGATPFRARLNGLKINKKIIMRIYTEAINKLEEYNKNYYNQLEKMIADYILVSELEEISNDELSFYFVTGMNQAGKFKFEKNNEEVVSDEPN